MQNANGKSYCIITRCSNHIWSHITSWSINLRRRLLAIWSYVRGIGFHLFKQVCPVPGTESCEATPHSMGSSFTLSLSQTEIAFSAARLPRPSLRYVAFCRRFLSTLATVASTVVLNSSARSTMGSIGWTSLGPAPSPSTLSRRDKVEVHIILYSSFHEATYEVYRAVVNKPVVRSTENFHKRIQCAMHDKRRILRRNRWQCSV